MAAWRPQAELVLRRTPKEQIVNVCRLKSTINQGDLITNPASNPSKMCLGLALTRTVALSPGRRQEI
jgi:hypothetical protein